MNNGKFISGLWIFLSAFLCMLSGCGNPETAFESECSRCHSTLRPLSLIKEPGAWRKTVSRMAKKNPEQMTSEEQSDIDKYLRANCTVPVEQLFEQRCGICHRTDPIRTLKASAFELAYLADVCRSRAPARIGRDETRRIVAWLTSGDSSVDGTGLSPLDKAPETDGEMFLYACGRCHTSEVFSKPKRPEQWGSILEKMEKKNPIWLTPDRVKSTEKYLREKSEKGERIWPVESAGVSERGSEKEEQAH